MSGYESVFSSGRPTEEEIAAVVLALLALSRAGRRRPGAARAIRAPWYAGRRVSQARGGRHVPPAAWPGLSGPGRAVATAAEAGREVPARV